MALVAASIIEPGLYFAMNTRLLALASPCLTCMKWVARTRDHHGTAERRYRTRGSDRQLLGFVISPEQILQTAKDIGEPLS